MRTRLFLLLYLCCTHFLLVNGQSKVSGRTVIQFEGESTAAIADLKNALYGYNAGIIRILKTNIGERNGQTFYLSTNSKESKIIYTTNNSLENAIYTLLDLWGFHWYGPEDHWFVKPKKINFISISGQWISPSFRNRSFFGTGGLDFGNNPPYDRSNNYKKKWSDWKRRNRFNADFAAVGHTGRAFYNANKLILDKNSTWFASEKGKINGRIKIEEPGAIKVYKQWVKNKYSISKAPFIAIGVDPEDCRGGVDDPLPKNMPQIKNHADKWWWLANEVAKEYTNQKNILVTMYAYGNGPTNALTPSFGLQKNVYPVIVPYAFQTAYPTPQSMIEAWANRIKGTMGMRDYWNITQWSAGMPQFNIYSIPDKLRFWHKNKVDGMNIETTDAAGPMGHALWLAGQMEWNVNQNFDQLYSQYLKDCFGNAAEVMRRMFDRWSKNYQGAGEIALCLRDLKEATSLIDDDFNMMKRLADLKAYVHFMKMYYEHDGTQKSKDAIFKYMYRIHHLMLVQTAAFVKGNYISPGRNSPSGSGIRPISYPEIEKMFIEDLKLYPTAYKVIDFEFDFDKVVYTEPINFRSWRFGRLKNNFFFKAPFSGTIRVDVGAEGSTVFKFLHGYDVVVNETAGKGNSDYIETIDKRTWRLKKYSLRIEKGESYTILTNGGFSRVKMITPGIVLFKRPGVEDFDNYNYPVQYFYVPKEATQIVFSDTEEEGRHGNGYLISPDGQKFKRVSTGMKDIYLIDVPPKWRGKVWSASFSHSTWSFKNIPNFTSLQKFQYNE